MIRLSVTKTSPGGGFGAFFSVTGRTTLGWYGFSRILTLAVMRPIGRRRYIDIGVTKNCMMRLRWGQYQDKIKVFWWPWYTPAEESNAKDLP